MAFTYKLNLRRRLRVFQARKKGNGISTAENGERPFQAEKMAYAIT